MHDNIFGQQRVAFYFGHRFFHVLARVVERVHPFGKLAFHRRYRLRLNAARQHALLQRRRCGMLHAAVLVPHNHNFIYAKLIHRYHQAAYYFVKRACNHVARRLNNLGFAARNAHGRL